MGVPLSTPPLERLVPGGSVPARSDQEYGDRPPLAAKVALYAWFTMPRGNGDEVVIVSSGGPTRILKVRSATRSHPRRRP